jgi:hypothetical protein
MSNQFNENYINQEVPSFENINQGLNQGLNLPISMPVPMHQPQNNIPPKVQESKKIFF